MKFYICVSPFWRTLGASNTTFSKCVVVMKELFQLHAKKVALNDKIIEKSFISHILKPEAATHEPEALTRLEDATKPVAATRLAVSTRPEATTWPEVMTLPD